MEQKENKTSIMRYAGLATQWMVMLLLAVWIGYKLDHLIGWRFPLLLILLPVISLFFSLWQIIKEFNKPQR